MLPQHEDLSKLNEIVPLVVFYLSEQGLWDYLLMDGNTVHRDLQIAVMVDTKLFM